jgi:hypothetical protein
VPAISFAAQIVPLFNPDTDIPHMKRYGVMLDNYAYMSNAANAQNVLNHIDGTTPPRMPPLPEQPWSADQITLFKTWMADGYQP